MSSSSPLVLGRALRHPRPKSAGSWLAFCGLALYGTLRWGTMLGDAQQGRLVASLLVALATAAVLRGMPGPARLRGAAGLLVAVAATLALMAIAGFSLSLHVGRVEAQISDGVGTFGNLLVPYNGVDPDVTATLVLSAGLLLLGAALAFGSVRRPPATGTLALAALPLLALAIVPSTIVEPELAYFHGLVGFMLVALLVFSPRLVPGRRGSAIGFVTAAALVGAVGAGLIAGDRLWARTENAHPVLGSGIGGTPVLAEQFNWQQTYGTLGWPYTGAGVLAITAPRPEHWKTEDLDVFNGRRWSTGRGAGDPGLAGVSPAHLAAYSETLSVNVDQIVSNQIIAAGFAHPPDLPGITAGTDPGTWVSSFPLRPGDSYSIRVYDPDPPAAQLAAAGTDYPRALAPFRTVTLPSTVYGGVQALARRLTAGTDSPYADVEAVMNYLQHGYVYTLDPPSGGADPLVNFLLTTKRGYCQQFAGAMALLLRLAGVPARVVTGFSSGERRPGTHTYLVADRDAHAWVEVWFPTYGWVTFDPTPGTATAAGSTPQAARQSAAALTPGQTTAAPAPTTRRVHTPVRSTRLAGGHSFGSGAGAGAHPGAGSGTTLGVITAGILGLLAVALATVAARAFWRRPSPAELSLEIERAFARCGQPLSADITLSGLARLVSDDQGAAAYVASLAAARYAPDAFAPAAHGRAALRRWLGRGGGPRAWLRAVRALPPRRSPAAP